MKDADSRLTLTLRRPPQLGESLKSGLHQGMGTSW